MANPRLEAGDLTVQDLQQLEQLLATIDGLVTNRTINLNNEERRKYGSVNETNKLIINKVADMIDTYPALIPPRLDVAQFKHDQEMRLTLERRIDKMQTLTYLLECAKIAYDYNNYHDALKFYNYVNFIADNENDSTALQVQEELKSFFTKTKTPDSSNITQPPV